jgi:hypothetical protein
MAIVVILGSEMAIVVRLGCEMAIVARLGCEMAIVARLGCEMAIVVRLGSEMAIAVILSVCVNGVSVWFEYGPITVWSRMCAHNYALPFVSFFSTY